MQSKIPKKSKQCFGLTPTFQLCKKTVDRGFFCYSHKRVWIGYLGFFIFTVGGWNIAGCLVARHKDKVVPIKVSQQGDHNVQLTTSGPNSPINYINSAVDELESKEWKDAALLTVTGSNSYTCTGEKLCSTMSGTYKVLDSKKISEDLYRREIEPICNERSYEKWQRAIQLNRKYVFPYYFLAVCSQEPKQVLYYANKAKECLMKTTQITPHDQGHDFILKKVDSILNFLKSLEKGTL